MNNLMKQLNARRGRHALLYVGGNALDAQTIRDMFASSPGRFVVECVETVSEGLERVMASSISAVLLDLRLPDGQGMDALDQLAAAIRLSGITSNVVLVSCASVRSISVA